MKSKFLSFTFLGKNSDAVKGLFLTVITTLLTAVGTALNTGGAVNWHTVGMTAGTVAIAYVVKQLTSNSDGTPLVAEEKK